jgi:hypothetical protein
MTQSCPSLTDIASVIHRNDWYWQTRPFVLSTEPLTNQGARHRRP